jgi:hypothetical protein
MWEPLADPVSPASYVSVYERCILAVSRPLVLHVLEIHACCGPSRSAAIAAFVSPAGRLRFTLRFGLKPISGRNYLPRGKRKVARQKRALAAVSIVLTVIDTAVFFDEFWFT